MTEPRRRATGPLQPGQLLCDRYRVVDVIGRGGAATVYRALDEQLGRTVAIKVITASTPSAAERRRLDDEVRLIAGFTHPGLVTLFDIITIEDSAHSALVMQYVDGDDLGALLTAGAVDGAVVAAIGLDISAALDHIHAGGVMHRDVKPANILLPRTRSGVNAPTALLADFGIARLVDTGGVTVTGTIIGTASYLSPEQARGAELSPATDIYSLGLVLLESLTGVRAFPGSAVESVAARLSGEPEIPTAITTAWRTLLATMLARDPSLRPTASAVHDAIGAIARGDGTLAATTVLPVALERTEVLAPSPEQTTEVLSTPEADRATEVLASPATPASLPPALRPPAQQSPAPSRAPRAGRGRVVRTAVIALVALLLLALIGWGVFALTRSLAPLPVASGSPSPSVTTPSASPSPTLDPVSYPAVDGRLGDRLADLQRSIEGVAPVATANDLQERVLDVTTAASEGDFAAAAGALDDFDATIADIPLTSAQRDAIESASAQVRKELDAAIKDATTGKGHGKN